MSRSARRREKRAARPTATLAAARTTPWGRRPWLWIAGATGALGLLIVIFVAAAGGGPDGGGQLAIDPDDPVLGAATAPVTMVEYADFKCPFCARFTSQTEPEIVRTYVDTGKVKLVWRDFVNIDAESQPTAEAASCAAVQGKFWPYHDALYDYIWTNFYGVNVNAEGRTAYTGHYEELAAAAGLDIPTFRSCVSSRATKDSVESDRRSGAQAGVQGTPSFFINGRKVVGAQPYAVFEQLIEQELSR